ncbi:MAG TPA: FAD-dependent oxidoreductase [Gemmatimonadaceae bacterium]|nr:FAD-dependent oxidoreductase [Gemmatimonadaceae bacterium]
MTPNGSPTHTADVIIIGGGLVGLCCAAALAPTGATIILLSHRHPGEASLAAAGMLAPSVEHAEGQAQRFAVAARDQYPTFLAGIEEATGIRVPLNQEGILELALNEGDASRLRGALAPGSSWLSAAELQALEPTLAPFTGAVLHERDGSVDNPLLLDALRLMLDGNNRFRVASIGATALSLAAGATPRVISATSEAYEGKHIVLAAGAWVTELAGLPRRLPVEPVRGQMVALRGPGPTRVSYGPTGYLVPRGRSLTLSGSTMERVGFRHGTTDEGVAELRASAGRMCPSLGGASVHAQWSGFRPMTPDGLPIIDREPGRPELIYACGHSRNGILLAPLTGACVAALVTESPPPENLTPFAATRFRDQ